MPSAVSDRQWGQAGAPPSVSTRSAVSLVTPLERFPAFGLSPVFGAMATVDQFQQRHW
ncbi:hypothetical protein ACFXGR_42290 [Streptomyces mirabilis]|uniref:hypothetical protein n=1 Tax=Streptomyces mirabilis TaxID=68239 RepID=UPI0036779CF3